MPTVRYRLLNVFAESTFGGNPLAVFEDGSALSDQEMQLIARQFNLSEATFLLPSSQAAARVRIFTPTYEMPFAGHPTLGTAHVVRELFDAGDTFSLEMQVGLIPVAADGDRWTLSAAAPTYRPLEATSAELAAMLGLPESAIAGPGLWVSCGNEQPMIPISSVAHVNAAKPKAELIHRHCTNIKGQPKVYLFTRTEAGFVSRFFWSPDGSVSEDPGTGSAAANLGGWWLANHPGQTLDAVIHQGDAIDRPNRLTLKVDSEQRIQVGGRVVELGRGELRW